MRNIKLTIEYDGTDFAGWQFQPGQRTVQGLLEEKLSSMLEEKISVLGSGRTDAGVHAAGQVANFKTSRDIPLKAFDEGLNSLLPRDVAIIKAEEVAENFHARFDAQSRRYQYQMIFRRSPLWERYAWRMTYRADPAILQDLAGQILGQHDFTAFASAQAEVNNFICRVEKAGWSFADDRWTFEIRANRFLHNMVRILVGTMIDMARGQMDHKDLSNILVAKDRTLAGKTAPACGLCLMEVYY
ncbi:MAG: tRNA pseudouridine(38-40) synthase TruA [Candidatus Edwardsbacteria bacterium]|nr:tRNA pseudouridine(38-40) synthase TruA [Candidatus Edwardsbacteria bacterium]